MPVWPHDGIDRCDRCIGRQKNTVTRLFLINNTLSTTSKLLHQTCIAGLVKYLSPYILDASQTGWHFVLSLFAHSKWITESCFLWDDFNGNIAISNVYKWRCYSDVIVIKLSAYSVLNPLQNVYFRIFIAWKITEWRRFVTYLSNDPRIYIYIYTE